MNKKNMSFKRLNKEENEAIDKFLVGRKSFTFEDIDSFLIDQNKKHGLFDNCSATVCNSVFIVQRPVGW